MDKPPGAEIIIIGNELTSGDVRDINGPFLAERLLGLGIKVEKISIVGDVEWAIVDALEKALKNIRVHYILVTGGLGPTKDDITSKVASKVAGRRLIISNDALEHIRGVMSARGKEMHPSQERQALIPQKAILIKNPAGTACGFTFHQQGKVLTFLPGVPKEMRLMADKTVLPGLKEEQPGKAVISSRLFRTFGLNESKIEEMISDGLQAVEGLKVSYLPSVAEVAVGVRAEGSESTSVVDRAADTIREALGDYIFGEDEETMEVTVGNLLRLKEKTLSVAESCTGGLVGEKITKVPGSSGYFLMGLVTYSNEAKHKLLGIQLSLIEEHGAVSSQVASAMAQGIKRVSRSDYGLAVTGIAGPGGGSPEKPVGTVFVALSSERGTQFKGFRFHGGREEIREKTAQAALDLLRKVIIGS